MSIASDEVRAILDDFSSVLADISNADAAITGITEAELQTRLPESPADSAGRASTSTSEFRTTNRG